MAEFIDVIHTIQRICKKNDGQCSVCMLGKLACPNNVRFDKTEEAAFRELEDTVVKWAAEYPEPVYPTWEQVIAEMYLRSGRIKYHNITEWEINEHIPADFAQKLGIEPLPKA